MEAQNLLPKSFLDLFEVKIDSIFNEEQLQELEKLPFNIKTALDTFVRDIQLKHESEKEVFLRQKDEYEQKQLDMESQLLVMKETEAKLSSMQSQCSEYSNRSSELSERLIELQSLLIEKEKSWSTKEQDLLLAKSQLDVEKKDLNDAVFQKNKEIDRLTSDWKQISEKLKEAISLKLDAQSKSEEARSELLIMQNRESRIKNELFQTSQQVTMLNTELQAKFEEILSIKKEKSTQLILLQSNYDEVAEKLSHAEKYLEINKSNQEKLEEQIELYIRKLKEAKDGQSILEEQYRGEISAQNKLIDLYKTSLADNQKKVEEMSNAVNELQRLNKEYSSAYEILKQDKEQMESNLTRQLSDREEQILNYEEELMNANQLLEVTKRSKSLLDEEIEQNYPAAAAASKLLKSGMSLTQIYTEYVKVSRELHVEKEERKRESEYLQTILKGLDEKAPILRQQKRDYEKSLEKIDTLTQQLNGTLEAVSQYQSNADDLFRNNCELKRKNDRYEQQLKDLSAQVRMLLKELEEERGTVVKLDTEDVPMSQDEVSSSSALITSRLVTFRSIEELHQKNVQLLDIVRELSSAAENNENASMNEGNEILQAQLDRALSEIEEMKAMRTKQTQLMDSIIQQRDMYKGMSVHAMTSSPVRDRTPSRADRSHCETQLNNSDAADVSVLSNKERSDLEALNTTVNEMRTEFGTYRKEKCENERMLNEDLASKNKELLEFRLKASNLESQLEFTKTRFKVSQSNADSHKNQADLLRDSNQKMSESVTKHQQAIVMLREELKSCQERVASAEARCQSLQVEKERLKIVEATLLTEAESFKKEKHVADMVLRNLQTIQNNLERSEFETKTKLDQRIQNLEKENAILKSKVEDTEDQHKSSKYGLERHLKEANEELDRIRIKCSGLEEMMQSSDKLVEHLKSELAVLQKKCQEVEASLEEKERILASNELHQLLKDEAIKSKTKLDQTSALLKVKEDELEQANEHLNQYKEMAECLEQNLNEQKEASDLFRKALEQEMTTLRTVLDETNRLKDLLEEKNLNLEEENQKLAKQLEELIEERDKLSMRALIDPGIIDELENVKEDLKVAMQARDQAVSNERITKKDLEGQVLETQQAHRNYEKELLSHAADVEQLSVLKRELADISNKFHNEKNKVHLHDQKIESDRKAWSEKEQDYVQKMTILKDKVSSLQTQNTLLHDEYHKLSQKMVEIQKQQEVEFDNLSHQASSIVDKETSGQKSSEQLFEVIRFLRREKEIAEVKYEGLEAETSRLRKQSDSLKKQLEETEENLLKEKEKLQIKLQTATEHAEMLRRIESIHLLQESNQLLREERDRISSSMRELQIKAIELDSKIGPLELKCMELEGERELFQKEIELAREEAGRWKTRTSNLIEQCSKFDPEEFKKAIEERDEMKIQLDSALEDMQKMKNDLSKASQQIINIQGELLACQSELQASKEEKESTNDKLSSEIREKTENINQLRKIGRKYRLQYEESQKEIEELKKKAEQVGMINELQAKLSASEQQCNREKEMVIELQKQIESLTEKIHALESEMTMLSKKLKDKDVMDSLLTAELNQLKLEHSQVIREKSSLESNQAKLLEDIKKTDDCAKAASVEMDSLRRERDELNQTINGTSEENIRLTEEVTKLSDDNNKLEKTKISYTNLLGQAKLKLEERNSEIKKLKSDIKLMESQSLNIVIDDADKISQEQQTSPAEVMEESGQQSTFNERLQRENQELKQKVTVYQKEVELLRKQSIQQTGKPILTTPPVERNILPSTPSDINQKRANVKPLTSASNLSHQQKHSTVQPVRRNMEVLPSTVPTVASIRPMAVAPSTPMATVMPTTMGVPENESTPTVVMSQSVITSHQIMRPTQQVQPVSHTEESTVSSSGEPGVPSTSQEQAPLPALSIAGIMPGVTAGEGGFNSSVSIGPSGVGPAANSAKRQRDESRTQDEPGEHDVEAPHKRLKIGEAADTTQSVAAGACILNTLDVEREAASRAQPFDAQQLSQNIMLLRRDSEPVTTSLEGHGNYNNQEDNSRSTPLLGTSSAEGSANTATSDELPDYQDLEYDPANSDPTTSGQMAGDGDEQGTMRMEDMVNVEEDVILDDDQVMEEGMEQRSQEEDAGADDDLIYISEEKFSNSNNFDYEEEQEMTHEMGPDMDSEERDENHYNQHLEDFDVYVKNSDEFDEENYVQEDDEESMANLEDEQGDSMPPLEVLPPISSSSLSHDTGLQQCGLSSETTPLIPPLYMRTSFPQADNPQTSFAGQTSRNVLTSLSFPEGYEVGDDGIVPSTPTNQFANKSDVFIEGTRSPRVEDQYSFREISEDHSGLAQQGGVDQTHIDLLDFDEGTSHDLMDNVGDEGDDNDDLAHHDTEKLDGELTDDDHLDEGHSHEEHVDDFNSSQQANRDDVGDVMTGSSRVPRTQDRTSDSVTSNKAQGGQKKNIQKIVWDEPPASQTSQAGPPPLPLAIPGPSGMQTRRSLYQIRGGRGNRAAVMPLLSPEYSQSVTRRGRGARGGPGGRRHQF